jgi:GNAT superfamily N-acetyltransferase
MAGIECRRLIITQADIFQQIANWYQMEWKFPLETTLTRLATITPLKDQFQLVMTRDGVPIGTAGVYNNVRILEKIPRLNIYKHWLALVYTIPMERGKGYGAMLCEKVEEEAKKEGLSKLHLYTDTAESLYKRCGWQVLERMEVESRNIVVMEKDLAR